jgi:two-component sensor histidine kinase
MTRESDRKQEPPIWYDESALLARLAEQQSHLITDTLAKAATTDRFAEENERLGRDLSGMRAALDGSLDRLQEVHHRVRNHLQTLTGLLSAQELSEPSPAVRQALQKSIARITSVAAIHDLLAREPRAAHLRLPELAQRLAAHLLHQAGAEQRLQVHTDIAPLDLPQRQATAFVLILTELLSNAIEHGFPDDEGGEIRVRISCEQGSMALEVCDSGRGLPPGFRLEGEDGLGLGLVFRLAERDLGGSARAWNETGACFRVTFPVPAEEAAPTATGVRAARRMDGNGRQAQNPTG